MAPTRSNFPTATSCSRLMLYTGLLACLFLSTLVNASSSPKPPIRRIDHPVVESLEVVPRRGVAHGSAQHRRDSHELRHSDSFRLTLTAYDETFHLHLAPNDDLVHPQARVNYYRTGPDGVSVLDRTEPLVREDVRAYHGDVVRAAASGRRLHEDAVGGLSKPDAGAILGWARILVHYSAPGEPPVFEGAFSVRGDVHHVATSDRYLSAMRQGDARPARADEALVIYRNSDMLHAADGERVAHTCAHDALDFNTNPLMNPALRMVPPPSAPWYDPLDIWAPPNRSIMRRDDIGNSGSDADNFINSIGSTVGCPSTQTIVSMGVAADCKYVRNYGGQQNATTAILNDWNMATAKYKQTFNISLGIVQLDIQDATCPNVPDPNNPWNMDCSTSVTLNDRLSIFSQWRGQRSNDNIGLWHLMSGCPTGTEVGVAWLGTLCQSTSTGEPGNIVAGTAVSTAGPTEWEVVTHEIGHNFGAIHDCVSGCKLTDGCCPSSTTSCSTQSQFIMNPTSSPSETNFSPCSIGNICTALRSKLNTTCLLDAGTARLNTIGFQMCGNGIVEEGEDCDPGLGSTSNCCNATTCKFIGGAVCDPASSPCCSQSCAFAPASVVCRPSVDAKCDIAEMCTGTSAQCPADTTQPNGMSCGTLDGDKLTCASGMCTSVTQQCKMTGAALNLSRACSSQAGTGCQLSCQDPNNANSCLVLQATLPNGSSCGYGGTCSNGTCRPGSAFDTAKAWYVQNLQIAVPITVVAGIIVLMLTYALLSALRRCCCGGERERPRNANRLSYIPPEPRSYRPVSQEALMSQVQPPPMDVVPVPAPYPAVLQPGNRNREFANGPRRTRQRTSGNLIDAQAQMAPRRQPQPLGYRPRDDWVDDTVYNGARR